MRRNRTQRAISRRAITTCRHSTWVGKTCTRFLPMARSSPTPATSTKSKRPARTTRFFSCRCPAAHPTRFPPAPEATPRQSTRRMEITSRGVQWHAVAMKPTNLRSLFINGRSGESRNATQDFDRSVDSLDLDAGFEGNLLHGGGSRRDAHLRPAARCEGTEGSFQVACWRHRLLQRRDESFFHANVRHGSQ